MRISNIILLLAILLTASCKPPMPPSDKEMIRHFAMHEVTFNRICEIMADSSANSFHYPPLEPEYDMILDSTGEISVVTPPEDNNRKVFGLSRQMRTELDSLLAEVGCGSILVLRPDSNSTASWTLQLYMPYYSQGLSISGTGKSFVYNPNWRNEPGIQMTEHGDLNEIYRRTYNDTILYKPINSDWYIQLDHDR